MISAMAMLNIVPTNSMQGFPLFHILTSTYDVFSILVRPIVPRLLFPDDYIVQNFFFSFSLVHS
jgi:hypothetical protein